MMDVYIVSVMAYAMNRIKEDNALVSNDKEFWMFVESLDLENDKEFDKLLLKNLEILTQSFAKISDVVIASKIECDKPDLYTKIKVKTHDIMSR